MSEEREQIGPDQKGLEEVQGKENISFKKV